LLNVSKLVIQSYAKVNLILEIISQRPDNYHNLSTIFERISLCDKIILKPRRDDLVRIRCADKKVPRDNSNLCWKAARLLQEKFKIKRGLDIQIVKFIPVGAGLGGGSSNAASVLLALNKLWKLKLTRKRLAGLGAQLGSDVPFFVHSAPFAQGTGRGEKIHPLKELNKVKLWHLLVVPRVHVSTPLIYRKFDAFLPVRQAGLPAGRSFCRLTKPPHNVKIIISKLTKKKFLFEPGLLFNSLEPVTLKLYPEVRRIKEKLKRLGLKNILMSGSGGAVFAIVPSAGEAAALAKRLKKEGSPWRIFAVSTV